MDSATLLQAGKLTLLTGPRDFTAQKMFACTVSLALRGPVVLLLAGNRFDFYDAAYRLAALDGWRYREILEGQIFLSRAETGYPFVELLQETRPNGATILVADALAPFADEPVAREADELLFEAIVELRRLKKGVPVIVSATPSEPLKRLWLALKRVADHVVTPSTDIQLFHFDDLPLELTWDTPKNLSPGDTQKTEHISRNSKRR